MVMVAGMVVELLCAAAASYSKWCSWRCCLFRVRSERTVALLAHKVFVPDERFVHIHIHIYVNFCKSMAQQTDSDAIS